MRKEIRARFWIALVLSLLLHAGLGGGLVLAPSMKFHRTSDQTSVELMTPDEMKAMIEAASQRDLAKATQIVESDKKPINDEIDPKAKYLSQFNQRVIKETRAAHNGAFNNSAGRGETKSPQPKEVAKQEASSADQAKERAQAEIDASDEAELKAFENGDVALAAKKGLQKFNPSFRKLPVVPDPTAEQAAPGDGQEVSKNDDHLENVATGMQTMLSTREFVYYSYYNRIKAKLRQYWEPKIKEKFERTVRQGRSVASEGNRITKVVIILDEKGTLIRVQILSASGLVDLDDAAVEAFRAAAPFPNPPKGIVDEDGTIRIRWDFVLEA